MKTKLISGVCMAMSFAFVVACHSSSRSNTDAAISTAPVDTSLGGQWYLQPQLPSDTGAGKIPQIIFSATEDKFTGNTGCNQMTGMFTRKGDSLRFDERIISTRMACMGYNEKAFIDNLLRTNRFEIKNGVLMLMENETILSKWVRKLEDQPIKKA
ncbi:heat shock protein HslJ [Filimonas zeae]|nr:META domain-containing protein [Filimonas zeae]MDR6342571.1 heat shock protein HslJ [Filimonas zeae]